MNTSSSLVASRRQPGFSLVEALLVMGVIAMLMMAAFVIFPQVQGAHRANVLVNQWQGILNVLPEEVDPSVLEKHMNRELQSSMVEGKAQWHLESDGRGKWASTLTIQQQGGRVCRRIGEAMVSMPGELSVNGQPVSQEVLSRVCNEKAPVQFTLAAIPGMLPNTPRATAAIAAPEGPEVDIYSSRSPAKNDQWNEAGGF